MSLLVLKTPEAVLFPIKALRLTFEYEGGEVRLISQDSIEKITPPSDILRGYLGQSGFWYELRDQKGRALYRLVMHNPISADVEVSADDEDGSFTRRQVDDPAGIFVLLVPDIPKAFELLLYNSPPATPQEPARAFARFNLQERPIQMEVIP